MYALNIHMLRLINGLRAAAAVVMTGRPPAPATSATNDLPEVVLPTRGKSAPEPSREPSDPAPPPVARSKTDSAAKTVETSGLVLMRRFLRPKVGDPALTAAEARALVIFVRTLPLRLIRLSPVPVSFYCQICLQHQPLNEPHTQLPCGHRFCRGCLLEYLTHKIESAEVVPLQYPHFGEAAEGTDPRCTFDVNEEQLVALGVSAALLAKYRKFVARQTVETHRECPQCEASNISGPSLFSNQLTCGQCGRERAAAARSVRPVVRACGAVGALATAVFLCSLAPTASRWQSPRGRACRRLYNSTSSLCTTSSRSKAKRSPSRRSRSHQRSREQS